MLYEKLCSDESWFYKYYIISKQIFPNLLIIGMPQPIVWKMTEPSLPYRENTVIGIEICKKISCKKNSTGIWNLGPWNYRPNTYLTGLQGQFSLSAYKILSFV